MDAYGRTLRSIPQGKPNWKKPIVRNRKKEKTFEEAKADALRERRKSDRDFEKLKSLMRKLHPPGSGLMRKVREAKKATRIA
ncbi:MAG: hypothetical protein CL928_04790 [Deltaproteobacteria bacterium]|nr:hypothetical protein [Deltaproteobacteria bacterium]